MQRGDSGKNLELIFSQNFLKYILHGMFENVFHDENLLPLQKHTAFLLTICMWCILQRFAYKFKKFAVFLDISLNNSSCHMKHRRHDENTPNLRVGNFFYLMLNKSTLIVITATNDTELVKGIYI